MIITGNFTARVGKKVENWLGVIGPNGIEKCNSNDEIPLAFCFEFQLVITNTVLKHKHHLNAWMYPRSKLKHLLDYVITRQRDQNHILDTKAMRGADCATDQVTLCSKLAFVLNKTSNMTKEKPRPIVNVEKLRNGKTCKEFQKQMDNIMDFNNIDINLEERWDELKTSAYSTAMETLGNPD